MQTAGPSTSEHRSRRLWAFGPERIDYGDAWELQRRALRARLEGRIPETLLLVEHPHVYTIGRRGGDEHILVPVERLRALGAEVYHIDRGGDITYHGPGQLVGYPILDLAQHRKDVHWYLRKLEDTIIDTLAEFGIEAGRVAGLTGVWVGEAKIAAIGIKVSRWITMHGFALNVTTDLRYFGYIVPCGIQGRPVTSMERLLNRKVAIDEVANVYVRAFERHFGLELERREGLKTLRDHLSELESQSEYVTESVRA